MSRWFRMYDCLLDDPKVQRLPERFFKVWVNVLCVASRNDGRVPCVEDLSFLLRMSAQDTQQAVDHLCAAGLLDKGKDDLSPHKWAERQYKSDVSTERVKRFRQRSTKQRAGVSATTPETDTESETEQKEEAIASSSDEAKLSLTEMVRRLEQATGWLGLPGEGVLSQLVDEGHSFEDRTLPLARDEAERRHEPPKSWTYLAAVVRDATRRPTASAKPVETVWVVQGSDAWKALAKIKKESWLRTMLKPDGQGGEGIWWPAADLKRVA